MNSVQDQIVYYQGLFAEISGPEFKPTDVHLGVQTPYKFSFSTPAGYPLDALSIEFKIGDLLCMNGKSRIRKLEYLQRRFGHLFTSRSGKN